MLRRCCSVVLAGLCLLVPVTIFASDCFQCHPQSDFSGKVVHAPVAGKKCSVCHDPHVSRHQGLLQLKQDELCFSCHQQVAREVSQGAVVHQPVREGLCGNCHAPHASANGDLLIEQGETLCFGCHKATEKVYKVTHRPYEQGQCSACHRSHAGDDYRMLRETGSALCLGCHKVSGALQSSHLGRDLTGIDCLTCHNPHGGDDGALLRAVGHRPFAQGNCASCHNETGSADSCLECHQETLDSFNGLHTHIGASGTDKGCLACHNPHVGDRPGLLPTNEGAVCRSCHADTFARRDRQLHQHQDWNLCSNCHFGHSGDNPAMLRGGQAVCSNCHDEHEGFTHPIGEDAIDPRNGQPMDCLTCHNANEGTMYKFFLFGSGERGLCVQCHQSY